jgi:hypothetical protein
MNHLSPCFFRRPQPPRRSRLRMGRWGVIAQIDHSPITPLSDNLQQHDTIYDSPLGRG